MKAVVVEYPGSHGIRELEYAFSVCFSTSLVRKWHLEEDLGSPDLLILPGGSAFGDYLRPGILCKPSRVTGEIRRLVSKGTPTLAFGNGFQILCQIGVLAGGFLPNTSGTFLNSDIYLTLQESVCRLTGSLKPGLTLRLPMSCYSGRFFIGPRNLVDVEEGNTIVFRYTNKDGETEEDQNFNGCTKSIASLTNKGGNVLAMMAHPERAVDPALGLTDGKVVLEAVISAIGA